MIPEIYINGHRIDNIGIGGVDNISIDGFQVRSIKCHLNIKTRFSNFHKKSIRSLFQSKLSLKGEKM